MTGTTTMRETIDESKRPTRQRLASTPSTKISASFLNTTKEVLETAPEFAWLDEQASERARGEGVAR